MQVVYAGDLTSWETNSSVLILPLKLHIRRLCDEDFYVEFYDWLKYVVIRVHVYGVTKYATQLIESVQLPSNYRYILMYAFLNDINKLITR